MLWLARMQILYVKIVNKKTLILSSSIVHYSSVLTKRPTVQWLNQKRKHLLCEIDCSTTPKFANIVCGKLFNSHCNRLGLKGAPSLI